MYKYYFVNYFFYFVCQYVRWKLKENVDTFIHTIYVAKRGFSVKHYFLVSSILIFIPALNKKSGPKYIVLVRRDFLKARFNNIIIPILCLKLLRLILREKIVF